MRKPKNGGSIVKRSRSKVISKLVIKHHVQEPIAKDEQSTKGDFLFDACYAVLSEEKRRAFRSADPTRSPQSEVEDIRLSTGRSLEGGVTDRDIGLYLKALVQRGRIKSYTWVSSGNCDRLTHLLLSPTCKDGDIFIVIGRAPESAAVPGLKQALADALKVPPKVSRRDTTPTVDTSMEDCEVISDHSGAGGGDTDVLQDTVCAAEEPEKSPEESAHEEQLLEPVEGRVVDLDRSACKAISGETYRTRMPAENTVGDVHKQLAAYRAATDSITTGKLHAVGIRFREGDVEIHGVKRKGPVGSIHDPAMEHSKLLTLSNWVESLVSADRMFQFDIELPE